MYFSNLKGSACKQMTQGPKNSAGEASPAGRKAWVLSGCGSRQGRLRRLKADSRLLHSCLALCRKGSNVRVGFAGSQVTVRVTNGSREIVTSSPLGATK